MVMCTRYQTPSFHSTWPSGFCPTLSEAGQVQVGEGSTHIKEGAKKLLGLPPRPHRLDSRLGKGKGEVLVLEGGRQAMAYELPLVWGTKFVGRINSLGSRACL